MRAPQLLEQLDRAVEPLTVLLLVKLKIFHRFLHLPEVEGLHRFLHLLQRLLELRRVHLLHDSLQLFELFRRLGTGQVALLHLARHLVQLTRQVVDRLLDGFLLLLQAFELAAVLPPCVTLPANLIAKLVEPLADVLGLLLKVVHLRLRFVLLLVQVAVLLRDRREAQALRAGPAAFGPAESVVVPHVHVVLDHIARDEVQPRFLRQQPVIRHNLIDLAGGVQGERDAGEVGLSAPEALLGQAVVQAHSRKPEVVPKPEP